MGFFKPDCWIQRILTVISKYWTCPRSLLCFSFAHAILQFPSIGRIRADAIYPCRTITSFIISIMIEHSYFIIVTATIEVIFILNRFATCKKAHQMTYFLANRLVFVERNRFEFVPLITLIRRPVISDSTQSAVYHVISHHKPKSPSDGVAESIPFV